MRTTFTRTIRIDSTAKIGRMSIETTTRIADIGKINFFLGNIRL
jgi:hypothetical protein